MSLWELGLLSNGGVLTQMVDSDVALTLGSQGTSLGSLSCPHGPNVIITQVILGDQPRTLRLLPLVQG